MAGQGLNGIRYTIVIFTIAMFGQLLFLDYFLRGFTKTPQENTKNTPSCSPQTGEEEQESDFG